MSVMERILERIDREIELLEREASGYRTQVKAMIEERILGLKDAKEIIESEYTKPEKGTGELAIELGMHLSALEGDDNER
jgi:hypothetical protein